MSEADGRAEKHGSATPSPIIGCSTINKNAAVGPMERHFAHILFLITATVAVQASVLAQQCTSRGPEILTIGSGPQLFLDDFLIAKLDRVKRTLQPPTKARDNPLRFGPDHAWERARMDAGSVLYDAQQQKFRMWYTVLMDKRRYDLHLLPGQPVWTGGEESHAGGRLPAGRWRPPRSGWLLLGHPAGRPVRGPGPSHRGHRRPGANQATGCGR